VLEDSITKSRYQFSKDIYEIVGRLTGKNMIEEIYQHLLEQLGDGAPDKSSIVEILKQLSRMEALTGTDNYSGLVPAPTPQKVKPNNLLAQLKNSPLFLRLPIFNPIKIISRYHLLTRVFYSKYTLPLLLTLFTFNACILFLHWPDLTHNTFERIFTRHNLIILWLLYPVVKTIHEFAHAFSVKQYGGEVTEMGLMLLLFTPVPYVDASDSASFTNKWQRIIVAGSGIIAELILASFALLLWTVIEPGLLRTIAFNTILICGVSTLIFNGNPLVRFDGYYILIDLIEMPNLATKSSNYLWNHMLRLFAGIDTGKPAKPSIAERRWYISYGLAALFYRLTIYGSIFYLFASKLGPPGALLGVLGITQILVLPLKRKLQAVKQSHGYLSAPRKILYRLTLFLVAVIAIVTVLPLPHSTKSEGVLWLPEECLIKMQSPGIITDTAKAPGEKVVKGDILFSAENQQLHHTILQLESQLTEFNLKEAAAFAQDPFEAKIVAEKISDLLEQLEYKKQQERELKIVSPQTGNFIIQGKQEVVGRYFQQGALLGFIQNSATSIRTLISQEDIEPILENLTHIEINIVSEPDKVFSGKLLPQTLHSTFKIPSPTLSTEGGGKIIINSQFSEQSMSFEEMFQLDIMLDSPIDNPFPGSRAYIKFHHDHEPLLFRWSRTFRQLFLSKFRG